MILKKIINEKTFPTGIPLLEFKNGRSGILLKGWAFLVSDSFQCHILEI
jgi:hypothetical protein